MNYVFLMGETLTRPTFVARQVAFALGGSAFWSSIDEETHYSGNVYSACGGVASGDISRMERRELLCYHIAALDAMFSRYSDLADDVRIVALPREPITADPVDCISSMLDWNSDRGVFIYLRSRWEDMEQAYHLERENPETFAQLFNTPRRDAFWSKVEERYGEDDETYSACADWIVDIKDIGLPDTYSDVLPCLALWPE